MFFRYVDDIFGTIHREVVQALISHLYSMEAAIRFMVEKEGKFPFLDMLIEEQGPLCCLACSERRPTQVVIYISIACSLLFKKGQWFLDF